MPRVLPLLVSLVAAAGASTAQGQKMKLGEVLVFAPAQPGAAGDGKGQLFQCDRGNRKGQSMTVWAGPAPGAPAQATEYRLLSPGTAGALPDVDVLGIHYIKVVPERREAFERFVGETLHPAVANLRPDLRLLYYRAERGPDAGSYIALFALTRQSRDKYWPGGADSDDLRAAFKPVQVHTKELATYLVEGSALTDPKFAAAVFESRDWADFVLVPR